MRWRSSRARSACRHPLPGRRCCPRPPTARPNDSAPRYAPCSASGKRRSPTRRSSAPGCATPSSPGRATWASSPRRPRPGAARSVSSRPPRIASRASSAAPCAPTTSGVMRRSRPGLRPTRAPGSRRWCGRRPVPEKRTIPRAGQRRRDRRTLPSSISAPAPAGPASPACARSWPGLARCGGSACPTACSRTGARPSWRRAAGAWRSKRPTSCAATPRRRAWPGSRPTPTCAGAPSPTRSSSC